MGASNIDKQSGRASSVSENVDSSQFKDNNQGVDINIYLRKNNKRFIKKEVTMQGVYFVRRLWFGVLWAEFF